MTLLQRRTYSIALMEFEGEYPGDRAIALSGPVSAGACAGQEIAILNRRRHLEHPKEALQGPVSEHKIPNEPFYDPSIHINLSHLRDYTLTLDKDEMMALDAVLLCYQANYRKRIGRGTKPPDFARHDLWIGYFRGANRFIRRQAVMCGAERRCIAATAA